MRRTPQFMRNYLAKCEEINMESDSWFIRLCMTSSVLFPIRWVAPPPQFFKICVLQLLQLDIIEDFDFFPQQHSPIVFVLWDLFIQLGECDWTLLFVLTYPVRQSEVCVHLKLQSLTSWSFNPVNLQHCFVSSSKILKPTLEDLTNLAVMIFTHVVLIL